MANTVNPSSLSASSPRSSCTPEPGPPRKRPRSELSSEERKEARAHRNRIAAQNSRDRRKAQFGYLERRVTELEEENRQLRLSIGLLSQGGQQLPTPPPVSLPVPVVPSAPLVVSPKSSEDIARERENAELKERIRTLERGWDAVVKALAAQGLPTGLAPTPAVTAPAPAPVPKPLLLTTPAAAFPSPAPSHSSLDFDIDISTPAPSVSSPPPSTSMPVFVPTSSTSTTPLSVTTTANSSAEDQSSTSSVQQDSTRHLARVATTGLKPRVSLQRVDLHHRSSRLHPSLTPWELANLRLLKTQPQRRVRSTNRRWKNSSVRFLSQFHLARRS